MKAMRRPPGIQSYIAQANRMHRIRMRLQAYEARRQQDALRDLFEPL